MKIKHWQGYGTVDAKKVGKSTSDGMTTLNILVTGDHEWGLVNDDEFTLTEWLVKRFDKGYERHGPMSARADVISSQKVIYTFTYRSE